MDVRVPSVRLENAVLLVLKVTREHGKFTSLSFQLSRSFCYSFANMVFVLTPTLFVAFAVVNWANKDQKGYKAVRETPVLMVSVDDFNARHVFVDAVKRFLC